MSQTTHHARIRAIQTALLDQETVEGWRFSRFRPLAYRVLLFSQHVTRRWYYWIPRTGEPVKLLHQIEPHVLDDLPGLFPSLCIVGTATHGIDSTRTRSTVYCHAVFAPHAVPYLSRVDAGTIELVRSFGVDVVTSADLVQRFEAVWTEEQLDSHRYAVNSQTHCR